MALISAATHREQMAQLVKKQGACLSGRHLALMLARMAAHRPTAPVARSADPAWKKARPAPFVVLARCVVALLMRRLDLCDGLALARIAYALPRLRLSPEVCAPLERQLVERSLPLLGHCSSGVLATLLTGLAARRRPHALWLDSFCTASAARMSRFTAPELASLTHALARLGHAPPAAWLSAALAAFRALLPGGTGGVPGRFGGGASQTGNGVTAPVVVKFLAAAVSLQARPTFNWLTAVLCEARRLLGAMTGRELALLVWALAEVGHTPDPLFTEAWYAAAAKQAGDRAEAGFSAPSLLLALQALPALDSGAVHGKFVHPLFPRLQALLPEWGGAELCQVLGCLVRLRLRPPDVFLDALLTEIEGKLVDVSVPGLLDCLWALGQLAYRPDDAWMARLGAQVGRQFDGVTDEQRDALVRACRTLQCDASCWTCFGGTPVRTMTAPKPRQQRLLHAGPRPATTRVRSSGGSSSSSSSSSSSKGKQRSSASTLRVAD